MSELTKEQYEELPEFVKKDYEEFDGVYKHAGFVKVKQTANELDAKIKQSDERYNSLQSQLDEYKSQEAEKIEQAKREALEKAKTQGDVDGAIKQYEERMADMEKRFNEEKQSLSGDLEKLQSQIKTDKRSAIVSDLASQIATDKGSKAFKALVANRIDVDPATGNVTYLDGEGRATSLDAKGFAEEIMKDDAFAPLVKSGVVTNGGGGANGNNGGRASVKQVSRSDFDAMSQPQRHKFIQDGGKVTD
jgi:uncharacterized phage infection (PIP) family protein YhgE